MPVLYSKVNKVAIVGLEVNVTLVAQYNPKEITLEKSASWTPHATSKQDIPGIEFTSSGSRTLSMELFFDTYEDGTDVSETYVKKLMQLISVIDQEEHDEKYKRPSLLKVVWQDNEHQTFQGVMQSLSTKYTMFLPDGRPVRATCNVKFLEAWPEFDDKGNRKGSKLGGRARW